MSAAQSSGTGARNVEEKVEDQDGLEQAEHDLLADLRRARRSLRLQGMDEPPEVGRLTLGQRIADAVATVIGSWSFIIVQSTILFVWITANLVGVIRGWDPYPFILLNLALSFQAAYAAPVIMMSPEPAAGHRSQGRGERLPDQCEGRARDRVAT